MPCSRATDRSVTINDGAACRSCGACCAFSPEWPRFSLEDNDQLDAIPAALISADVSGMRCDVGGRCSALLGEVGRATECAVYALRPDVCRACVPGGGDCITARQAFGLEAGF